MCEWTFKWYLACKEAYATRPIKICPQFEYVQDFVEEHPGATSKYGPAPDPTSCPNFTQVLKYVVDDFCPTCRLWCDDQIGACPPLSQYSRQEVKDTQYFYPDRNDETHGLIEAPTSEFAVAQSPERGIRVERLDQPPSQGGQWRERREQQQDPWAWADGPGGTLEMPPPRYRPRTTTMISGNTSLFTLKNSLEC
ncbi:MAG: hypothetical protein Q9166_007347 [cf. Caloplaca sp. 2 TL-2023]